MKLRYSSTLAITAIIAVACGTGGASPTPGTTAPPSGGATATPGGGGGSVAANGPFAGKLGTMTIPAGEPIHLAFWGVISGSDAPLGVDSQRGVELAIADRGGKLLNHDIQLTAEDALCTPEGGATAGQKLAADTTIVGLVGSTCSDETVGGIQAINAAGMTTISPSNTRPAFTDPDQRTADFDGYLRTAHSDAVQGKSVAQFVYDELGLRTAATIHDGSAYAQALQQVFADAFTELGGTVVAQEAVQKGQTDMKPVLTTIASSNGGSAPDVLYFPIFTAEGGYVVNQVRDVPGMEDIVLIGSDGMFSAQMVANAGPNAEGMYLSSPNFSAFTGDYAGFVSKYEAKYGEKPIQAFHAHAYDAAGILMDAIEAVAQVNGDEITIDRGALRDAIYATHDFQGVTGTLACNPYGDCSAPVIGVYQITAREVGGEWPPEQPVWP